MKKLMLVLFSIVPFIFSSATVSATDSTSMPSVEIDGVREFLYKEFDNQEQALNNIVNKYADIFKEVKQKYNIKENISTKNWEIYRESIDKLYGKMNMRSDLVEIRKFFDIFENKYQND